MSQEPLPPRSVWRRLNLVLTAVDSLFSDKLTSPSGVSWPLLLTVSQFYPSAALFALHPAVSAISVNAIIGVELDRWLAQAQRSGIHELKSFANGIRRDYAAVHATFTSEWSNGPVEAQVNCLKLQKRLMFGRTNFDLLRLHVLRRA